MFPVELEKAFAIGELKKKSWKMHLRCLFFILLFF